MAVLGYLPKWKRGSGTDFWGTFSAWFFHKIVSYFIFYQWAKFQCPNFFPSQDFKQHVLLSSYLDSWWRHKLQDLSWIWLESNGWQREKEGKMEKLKFEYLENEKSFLNEIKNIFHSFWRAIIWWKIRICEKITDTSFKKFLEKDSSVSIHERNIQVLTSERCKFSNNFSPPYMNEIF